MSICAAIGPNEIIINDQNYGDFVSDQHLDGEDKMRGLIPRDYSKVPYGSMKYAAPFPIPTIPEDQWEKRLALKIEAQDFLSEKVRRGDHGNPIPSRDQNGQPYCWSHSSCSAIIALRAYENQPYADLSAYAVACIIMNYRSSGGYGAQSLEFIAERGIPSATEWPQKSKDKKNDNPKTWENAAHYKFINWVDIKPRNKAQFVTCLLLNIPVVSDFNWWSHSVCTLDLVSLNPFRTRIWNSWGDAWSDKGMGILEGDKAIPDGMVAPVSETLSLAM